MQLKFLDKLPKEIEKKMIDGFVDHETSHGITINYKKFSIVLTDDDALVGVLNAYTAFAEVYVDDLFVHKDFRGRGYGTQLLKALEDRFQGQGFNNINLVTNAFSAPDFYKKCGYTLEFIRENKQNPKLNKYFFVKFLL